MKHLTHIYIYGTDGCRHGDVMSWEYLVLPSHWEVVVLAASLPIFLILLPVRHVVELEPR